MPHASHQGSHHSVAAASGHDAGGVRVVGVDPGLARTGIAVVDGVPGALRLVFAGCIETHAGVDDAQRLHVLHRAVVAVCREHRPREAAVEEIFFATNRRSAVRVSEARGVILSALAAAGVGPVAEYTPLQVKESVAGWGAADKAQVARMTAALLSIERVEGPDDTADACAIAVCHQHRRRLAAGLPPSRIAGMAANRATERLTAAVEAARRAVP